MSLRRLLYGLALTGLTSGCTLAVAEDAWRTGQLGWAAVLIGCALIGLGCYLAIAGWWRDVLITAVIRLERRTRRNPVGRRRRTPLARRRPGA